MVTYIVQAIMYALMLGAIGLTITLQIVVTVEDYNVTKALVNRSNFTILSLLKDDEEAHDDKS